jgi:hypothetical protein
MLWQKITLTNRQVAQGHLERFLKESLSIKLKSGNPGIPSPLMGEPDMENNNTINIYFSPEIVPFWTKLLSEYSSTPCDPPDEPVTPFITGK